MQTTETNTPALRVSSQPIRDGRGAPGRSACIALLPEPGAENPWRLDAVLAVAEGNDPREDGISGDHVLIALRDCLREAPPLRDELALAVPELLASVHLRLQSQGRDGWEGWPDLSLVFVQGRRYCAAREGGASVYLFRDERLQPLTPDPFLDQAGSGGDAASLPAGRMPWTSPDEEAPRAEPIVRSGFLEEGDALLAATPEFIRVLTDREIGRALRQSHSPRTAGARLSQEAAAQGAAEGGLALLYAGSGPVLAGKSPSEPRHSPAAESGLAGGGRRSGAEDAAAPAGIFAMLAGVTGALVGITAGIVLAVMLIRPGTQVAAGDGRGGGLPVSQRAENPAALPPSFEYPAPSGPAPAPLSVVQPPAPANHPADTSGASPANVPGRTAVPPSGGESSVVAGNSPANGPAASAPGSGAGPAPVPAANGPSPGAPATQASSPRQGAAPPVHSLAPGMSSRVQLQLVLDTTQGSLVLNANQGALFTASRPQGVPAGTALVTPAGPLLGDRVPDGRGELRLLDAANHPVFTLRGQDVIRMARGEPILIPGLLPGEYQISWWHPDAVPDPPFLNLRVAGFR